MSKKERFEFVTVDHNMPFNDAFKMLEEIAPYLKSYGDVFSANRLGGLSYAAVHFAIVHNIVSPIEYAKKMKTFSFEHVLVLNKWGDVIIKSNRKLAKQIVRQIIVDFVKSGAATDRCQIGLNVIEMMGEFAVKAGMPMKALKASCIGVKGGVKGEDVQIVLKKMFGSSPLM
jgi:hypothetical protein